MELLWFVAVFILLVILVFAYQWLHRNDLEEPPPLKKFDKWEPQFRAPYRSNVPQDDDETQGGVPVEEKHGQ